MESSPAMHLEVIYLSIYPPDGYRNSIINHTISGRSNILKNQIIEVAFGIAYGITDYYSYMQAVFQKKLTS